MSQLSRRQALKLLTSVPAATVMTWIPAEAERASERAEQAVRQAAATGSAFQPKFFTAREYATVRKLADWIIPKDERSGSATDAGVPEFMDFMMIDQPTRQTAMRGGLAMINHLCEARFDKVFVECTDAQQQQLIDEIAYPSRVKPELRAATTFFTSFRDLTASGFFSSKMGVADLQYMGNRVVMEWNGCPAEALNRLGVKYEGE